MEYSNADKRSCFEGVNRQWTKVFLKSFSTLYFPKHIFQMFSSPSQEIHTHDLGLHSHQGALSRHKHACFCRSAVFSLLIMLVNFLQGSIENWNSDLDDRGHSADLSPEAPKVWMHKGSDLWLLHCLTSLSITLQRSSSWISEVEIPPKRGPQHFCCCFHFTPTLSWVVFFWVIYVGDIFSVCSRQNFKHQALLRLWSAADWNLTVKTLKIKHEQIKKLFTSLGFKSRKSVFVSEGLRPCPSRMWLA